VSTAQQLGEESESGRGQGRLVADAERPNAGIVPVDVELLAFPSTAARMVGMLMRCPGHESFRVQPAPDVGNFLIRIVDPGIE
jgi:hypothetical protein